MFILAEGGGLVSELIEVFAAGGWIMLMLGSVAFILYVTAFASFAYVNRGNLTGKDSKNWAKWIEQPETAEGRMGEALQYVMHGPRLTIKTVQRRFAEVRLNILSAIDRRLLVVNTLVAAAPLAGLLGTVMGMLTMFNGLAQGGGAAAMTRASARPPPMLKAVLWALINILLPALRGVAPRLSITLATTTGSSPSQLTRRA